MAVKLAFVHTSPVLIPLFSQLAQERLPGVGIFHMDESLIRDTIAAGRVTKSTIRRMVSMIGSAHEGGADAVMVTCSSIGPGVAVARSQFDFPILRVDQAMAETAVEMGRWIELVPELCEGAFEAILSGDPARHDALLSTVLRKLKEQVDVVVLAQASMARVVEQFQSNGGTPIRS